MIVDFKRFIATSRPYWNELEAHLKRLEGSADFRWPMSELKRFHYLYRRASADLARISELSAQNQIRRYLEDLVSRAYAEVHESRRMPYRTAMRRWLAQTFPQTFRKHWHAFLLSAVLFVGGSIFGAAAIYMDPTAKSVLMPFEHLQEHPSVRVAKEEQQIESDRLEGAKARFSAFLMTHNTRIAIATLALGATFGFGTIIILFSNGVMLGAVAADYWMAGETEFLMGWLLPHGATEIPAIVLAGQAGLVLASALIGWGQPIRMRHRLHLIRKDIVTLIFGVALLLLWAGLVEAFFSQYHHPILPYGVKIGFGVIELMGLIFYLWRVGAGSTTPTARPPYSVSIST